MYTVCMSESICVRFVLYICLCVCVHVHVSGHADNCVGHVCICECAHVCLQLSIVFLPLLLWL